ncbi:hypothetical protein J6TS7_29030 [Paenibacillus dendritiformis]|uniref:DNA adenine methylase n=1 Tax=Paenibacillus TaxID=44249 RepID=UPI001B085F46|nr:DNA adenine methylase [Paenibacillus dendritiformis]GIO79293.1 hypothetical protein J6TS7_29030 [Paenibacillus dendritiformis]
MTDKERYLENDIICKYCFEPYEGDELDPNGAGYWCGCCDGYNFFDSSAKWHQFTLIMEEASEANKIGPKKYRLNKRLSPLRYPGGKSKIADYIRQKINPEKSERLISAFAGGASVELALLHAGIVNHLVLNDLDFGIFSLFKLIKELPDFLTLEIQGRKPSHDDFLKARSVIKSGYDGCDLFEAAWSLLIANRLAFSGIYRANPLGGLRGTENKLLSRWNPNDLCRRISIIHAMSERITVSNTDALELIEEEYWNDRATIFADPPYFKQGKNLYRYYYEENDHLELQLLLDELHKGFPCADIILCYDDSDFIESIYRYPSIEKIKRRFSA